MSFLDSPIFLEDLPEQDLGDFSPIPEGTYTAIIKSADLSPTKDGTGQYIKMRLDVTGPTHTGRVLFSNLNIRNKSSAAETIGRQQLGSIMKAIGLAKVEDTDQLIGGVVSIKVGIRPADGQYQAQNEIKSYSAATSTASAPIHSVASTEPTKSSPPWAKK